MKPVVFDIDGTLYPRNEFVAVATNPEAVAEWEPLPGAMAAIYKAQVKRGVAFLTGRGEALRGVTLAQLRKVGVFQPRLVMQEAWRGWDAYRAFKVAGLRALQACCYVGDTRLDREIADEAGVAFRWPRDLGIEQRPVVVR